MTEEQVSEQDEARHEWLAREIEKWLSDGVIDEGQAQMILSRYANAPDIVTGRAGPGRLITAISAIGAVLLGVGAILFFAANWSAIPQVAKVGLVFGAVILAYGAGFALRYVPGGYPRVGDSMILLGALFYGAAIFLIEQIFHMNAGDPIGVLLWSVGILPLAYAIVSRSVLTLGLLTLLLWLGWLQVVSYPAVSIVHGLLIFYLVGLALMAGGRNHRRWQSLVSLEGVFVVLGLAAFLIAFHVLTHPAIWEWASPNGVWRAALRGTSADNPAVYMWALLGLTFVLILKIPLKLPGVPMKARPEALALIATLVLPIMVYVYPAGADYYAIVFNIAYFLFLLFLIALGYGRADGRLVNIGLIFMALGIVARYFDLFWDLLPRSAFFMAGGLALLVGSLFLERTRRRILGDMQAGNS